MLKNWRSHSESSLNFGLGTNVLVGILGSGKTSILDAICFALFGTFPNLQTRKLKLDDIIMKKPMVQDKAEVELKFVIDGSNYSVKRIVEKGKGTSYSEVSKDGKVIESPSTQRVTECVEKVLKVNYELFSKAIYSEQNSIDYFLTIGKGQRIKKIDELLMIDKFEKARMNSVKLTNKMVERKLAVQSVSERTDEKEISASIDEISSTLQGLNDESARLEKTLAKNKGQSVKLEKEVKELKSVKQNLEMLKRKESSVISAIEETKRVLKNMQSIEKKINTIGADKLTKQLGKLSKNAEQISKQLKERRGLYQKMQAQLAQSKTKIEFLRNEKIKKLEVEIDKKLKTGSELENLTSKTGENVDDQLTESRKNYRKLVEDLASLKARVSDLQNVLATLSEVEGTCPICDSRLTEERRKLLIQQKNKELKELKQQIEKFSLGKTRAEKVIDDLESAAKKIGEMLTEVKDLDELKVELQNSKEIFLKQSESTIQLDNEISKMKNDIELLEQKATDAKEEKQEMQSIINRMSEYDATKKRLDELRNQQDEIFGHLKEVESRISEEELNEKEELLRNALAVEREVQAKIDGILKLKDERALRLKELNKMLSDMQKGKLEGERLDRLIKELKIFTEALKQTQNGLREEFVATVNYTISKLWQTLYPYRDFVDIRLAIEEGDYVLQLQERNGDWINVDGIASGGERSIACLTLRIAFSLVLAPQLGLLILDEPTANLDSQAIRVLSTTLRENIQELVDQCFIITHQPEMEEAVTGSAYRLERDKANDGYTKVILLQ